MGCRTVNKTRPQPVWACTTPEIRAIFDAAGEDDETAVSEAQTICAACPARALCRAELERHAARQPSHKSRIAHTGVWAGARYAADMTTFTPWILGEAA